MTPREKALEEALKQARDIARKSDLSDEERADLAGRVAHIESEKAAIAEEKALRATLGEVADETEALEAAKSFGTAGEAFVASAEFAAAKAAGFRGNSAPYEFKAEPTVVDETTALPALVVAQRVGTITGLASYPANVVDLIPVIQTGSNAVTYFTESSETHTIDTAAEGAEKGNFTLDGAQVTDEVEVIAGMAAVTRQVLEDAPFMAGFVNQRMTLALRRVEEDQVLNGTGTTPDLNGLLTRNSTTTSQGADTVIDAIYKAANDAYVASGLQADAVVIHPNDWEGIAIATDGNERYYGPGPFANAQGPTVWGLRVVQSTNIAANTILVGAFRQGAFLARNGGLVLRTSDSHSDYFKKNKVAVLIEERVGLACPSPAAFSQLTLGV